MTRHLSDIGEVNRYHYRPLSARGIVRARGGMLSSLIPSTTYVTAPRCATIAVGEWMLKHRRGVDTAKWEFEDYVPLR